MAGHFEDTAVLSSSSRLYQNIYYSSYKCCQTLHSALM